MNGGPAYGGRLFRGQRGDGLAQLRFVATALRVFGTSAGVVFAAGMDDWAWLQPFPVATGLLALALCAYWRVFKPR